MSDVQWFYARDGARGGPVADAVLRQMLASGELRPMDLVWREGMAQWDTPGNVTELAAVVSAGAGAGPHAPPIPPPVIARPPHAPGAPLSYAGSWPHPGARLPDAAPSAGTRMLLPVGRSGWAIASGYLGLLSIFPFVGCLFGVAAVITGCFAIADMRKHPERHGMGRAVFGIAAGALFALVWGFAFVVLMLNRR